MMIKKITKLYYGFEWGGRLNIFYIARVGFVLYACYTILDFLTRFLFFFVLVNGVFLSFIAVAKVARIWACPK